MRFAHSGAVVSSDSLTNFAVAASSNSIRHMSPAAFRVAECSARGVWHERAWELRRHGITVRNYREGSIK